MNSLTKLLLARSRTVLEGEPVPSPCMSVCRLHAISGLCEGCYRTLEEIADWSGLDDAGKRDVWLRIRERAAA